MGRSKREKHGLLAALPGSDPPRFNSLLLVSETFLSFSRALERGPQEPTLSSVSARPSFAPMEEVEEAIPQKEAWVLLGGTLVLSCPNAHHRGLGNRSS
jgi:hypothetical protein